MSLKQRFLEAVSLGNLGKVTELGIVVTVAEFKAYFNDINTCYVKSFLPAAAIEQGQHSITHTHYVFRVRDGVYLVHPDVLKTGRERSKLVPGNKVLQHRFKTEKGIDCRLF